MALKIPRIGEVMSPLLVTLRTDRTLDEAEEFLRTSNIYAAPVVTPGGNVVGVITDFQLLKCILKRSQQSPNMNLLGNYLTELSGLVTIGEYESVSEGFKRMLTSTSRRVFVTDNQGKLIGVLEPMNLYAFIGMREEKSKGPRKRFRMTADGRDIPPAIEELVFDGAPCPVHSADSAGKIIAANRVLHEMLGYNDGELLGKTLKDLYPAAFHDELTESLEKIKESGYLPPIPTSYVRKDQELVKVTVTSVTRYDSAGLTAGIVTVAWLPDGKIFDEQLRGLLEAIRPIVKAPSPG